MSNETQEDKHPIIQWEEAGRQRSAKWLSESRKKPQRVIVADDTMKADTAYRHACAGTAMLWRGDFQNAKQLQNAVARRVERKPEELNKKGFSPAEAFHRQRMALSNRARILGMLVVELEPNDSIRLNRAPDVRQAIAESFGEENHPGLIPLRELLGIIGAHEWRKKGIEIPFLGNRIYPHYGVFPPTRGEYISLVAETPLPSKALAFDIGTGTGVLAAVLAKRGVSKVIATDNDPRAIACAKENITHLGMADRVEVVAADLFPPQKAPLIVCNPPWIPAKPVTTMEKAVYDPKGRILKRFLNELPDHLEDGGEAWLLLSDLAEQLGLRSRGELLAAFTEAGLAVSGKIDIRPTHPRAMDEKEPLHAARCAEITSLWRLHLA